MASSNRTQVISVKETTVGTTPNTPRMRLRRLNGESLKWVPTFDPSDELRSDGMHTSPIKTGEDSDGGMTFELSYPYPNSPQATDIESAFHAAWSEVNSRDNDGTADSVITAVTTAGTVLTVTTGTTFVLGEVYKFSGFGVTLNNGNFRCTTGSATVPAFASSGITDEAVPPAAARVKAIGFAGVASDITATATGLGSTLLNFTTIPGIAVGKWLKIDSTTSGFGFATAALNTYIRVTAITATALTCDNLPSGWTTDTGSGKTIRVYFGDQIKNGTTQIGQSIEKGFLGMTVPVYILQPGMVVSEYSQDWTAKKKIMGSVNYLGMTGGTESTTSSDASPDAATTTATYPVMACSANVGRIGEGGSTLGSPNFVQSLQWKITNPLTAITSVSSIGAAAIGSHDRQVTGSIATLFGDTTLSTKFRAGTLTSLNARAVKANLALVVSFPQITYDKDGSANAGGSGQDVMLPLGFTASKEETYTNAMILLDRFEYVDA